ncbi:MAG: type II toxin-antitoxin system VapC family toxin [Chloroflexota bacterium]|nr:type II toxin-antitoxin system VapC family toxin [Chloroflexota bacterium]
MSLPEALRPHARIGLDTSVFIYQIEAATPFTTIAGDVLGHVARGSVQGVTSVLTLTELLVKPFQFGRSGLAVRYEALIRATPNLEIVDINTQIARQAALLRATYQLRTADALQIASSLEYGATAFVTNDFRLRRVDALAIIVLADYHDERSL